MGDKYSIKLNIALICGIFLLIMVADLLSPEQFLNQDKWMAVKTYFQVFSGKQEVNGVYLGGDDYLLQQHLPNEYPQEVVDTQVDQLKQLTKEWDARVMLIPTADQILSDKLPVYAPTFDQKALLKQVKESIGDDTVIDVFETLQEHDREYLYYRTDSHWTSLNAYYCYQVWAESQNLTPRTYDPLRMKRVQEHFRGDLQEQVSLHQAEDTICYFEETGQEPVNVTYDGWKKAKSLYEWTQLDSKYSYDFFMDGSHVLTEIQGNYRNGKTLFVLKDSYGNALIPFLVPHYQTVYALDIARYQGDVEALLRKYEPQQGMEVLVLYNCIDFLEDFKYHE